MKKAMPVLLCAILLALSLGPANAAPAAVPSASGSIHLPDGRLLDSFPMSDGSVMYLSISTGSSRALELYQLDDYGIIVEAWQLVVDAPPTRASIVANQNKLTVLLNWSDGEMQSIVWESDEVRFAQLHQLTIYIPLVLQ